MQLDFVVGPMLCVVLPKLCVVGVAEFASDTTPVAAVAAPPPDVAAVEQPDVGVVVVAAQLRPAFVLPCYGYTRRCWQLDVVAKLALRRYYSAFWRFSRLGFGALGSRLDLPFVLLLSLRLHSVELVRIKRVDVFGIVLVGFGAGFFGFAWLDRLGRLAFERRVVENSYQSAFVLVAYGPFAASENHSTAD